MTAQYRLSFAKLYRSKRWQRMRARHLVLHPYCQCPHHKGQSFKEDAMVVDHIKPHRGDVFLFWDDRNLQTMTKTCHDRFKQSEEKGGVGFLKGSDVTGWPLSREHDWYGDQYP